MNGCVVHVVSWWTLFSALAIFILSTAGVAWFVEFLTSKLKGTNK